MSSKKVNTKKAFPKSTKNMSEATLKETLIKKRECDRKALKIVEEMCDGSVDEAWFLDNLQHINLCHLDDIIVERAISKHCGYALCQGQLATKIPKQQYHISLKTHKVYDISERKNFCSSKCYQSAEYVKKQMLTSPLWYREHEVIPQFSLLQYVESSLKGSEVLIGNENNADNDSQSVEDKSENEPIEKKCDKELDKRNLNWNYGLTNCIDSLKEDISLEKPCVEEREKLKINIQIVDSVNKVEKSVSEWFSFDTMLFLYGEDKVKELLQDNQDILKNLLTPKTHNLENNSRIEKLTNMFSLLEPSSPRKDLKPLPNYSILQQEAAGLTVKVNAFYSGQLEVDSRSVHLQQTTDSIAEEDDMVLPLVDNSSQNALRRKIVIDALKRIIPDILSTLAIDVYVDMSEVRSLLQNCVLGPKNITFRRQEWYLLAVIILKLLAERNHQLKAALTQEQCSKHLTLLLLSYQLEADYLDNILEWLTDPNNVFKS